MINRPLQYDYDPDTGKPILKEMTNEEWLEYLTQRVEELEWRVSRHDD